VSQSRRVYRYDAVNFLKLQIRVKLLSQSHSMITITHKHNTTQPHIVDCALSDKSKFKSIPDVSKLNSSGR
jgi:hypothetical protein